MKLFKGEMSLWAQLKDGRKMHGPGGLTDRSTYRGPVGSLVAGVFAYFFFWNVPGMEVGFWEWLRNPGAWLYWAPPWNEPPGDLRKYHFYAIFWLLLGVGVALLGFIYVWGIRRNAKRSTKGQWYDRPGLTKADLYGQPHDESDDE